MNGWTMHDMLSADAFSRLHSAAGSAQSSDEGAAGSGTSSGEAHFVNDGERAAARTRLLQAGWAVVELEPMGASVRGRLAEAIDDAVERALSARGAGAPGLAVGAEREATLSDQLFRARRAGARGIAILLRDLRGVAASGTAGRTLALEDGETLRFLAGATRDRPLVLLLDALDEGTGAYFEPTPLRDLLPSSARSPAIALTSAVARASLPPLASLSPPSSPTPLPCPPPPSSPSPPPSAALPSVGRSSPASTTPVWVPSRATPTPGLSTTTPPIASVPGPPLELGPTSPTSPRAPQALPRLPSLPRAPAERTAWTGSVDAGDDTWRTWTQQLAAARGPQPLAALERLFTETYVPLTNAIAFGLEDPRARSARDEFAATFSRSYTEALATFTSTNKRPRMVFDAHEIAGRIARLHGARSMRLLLVDAMRWDLSRAIEERLIARMGARAALTDELLLWSALPTTTIRQLETIARGIEAFRAPAALDPEGEPPRGRTAEYVRRMRVGPREVHKLDLVEARLQAARGQTLRELPAIADATAETIARHAETLAPRTLLFAFGDHGFVVDKSGTARQGGASPEEVLVGAFALLVGDVH